MEADTNTTNSHINSDLATGTIKRYLHVLREPTVAGSFGLHKPLENAVPFLPAVKKKIICELQGRIISRCYKIPRMRAIGLFQ